MAETNSTLDGLDPVERAAVRSTLANNPELAQLPPELQGDALKSILDAVRAQRQLARAVVGELEKSRDEIVKARAQVEARWVEDINQYEGESTLPASKEYATDDNKRERDTQAKVNLTRARTNMAAARIADMLFPANDRNWDIQPPNDRLKAALSESAAQAQVSDQPAAQPAQPDQVGQPQPAPQGMLPGGVQPAQQSTQAPPQSEQPSNKDRCDAMREVIQNQLAASDYSEHGRRMIEDGCKLGVGVMKGPFTRLTQRKKFSFQRDSNGKMVAMLDVVEERVPQCTRVDPRFFYPENVSHMSKCERAFELHLMSRAELKDLARQDSIDAGAVELLLMRNPDLGAIGKNLEQWNKHCVIKEAYKDKYAVWEMHGVLSKEELIALGMQDLDSVDMIPIAEVWFCQGEVLRVSLTVLEVDRRPPYWVWNYERADDTLYGYGVPWLYRNPQRCIDSLWLMLMHNLSTSAGPQVFIKKGIVRPMDGHYAIRGPKLWEVTDEDTDDVSKAFRAEVLPNNAPEIMDVLKLAMELGDEEISLPSIAQGNPNEAVPTAAGLIQLLNASNIVQRRCAKSMDDDVISGLIERFYVWNMLHGKDDSIKGDFAVSARGTSVLLHKDIKAQHLQITAQLINSNPRWAVYLKDGEFLRQLFDAADVSSLLLLRTDQEAEALLQQQAQSQQPQPSAADQAKAQALMAQVQLEQQKLQYQQQQFVAQQQQAAQGRALLYQEKMAALADKAEDRKANLYIQQQKLQIMAVELANDRNIALADIEKTLQIAESSANLKQFLAGIDARMQAAKVANSEREMSLKLDPANPTHTGI